MFRPGSLVFRAVVLLLSSFACFSVCFADFNRWSMDMTVSGLDKMISDQESDVIKPFSERPSIETISPIRMHGNVEGEGPVTFEFTERQNRTWPIIMRSDDGSTYQDSSDPIILRGVARGRHGLESLVAASWEDGAFKVSWVGKSKGKRKHRRYFEVSGKVSGDGESDLRVTSRPVTPEKCGNEIHPEVNTMHGTAAISSSSGGVSTSSLRELEMLAIVEETFLAKYGSGASTEVARILAGASQIYENDLNIKIKPAAMIDGSGQFSSTEDSGDLLADFADRAFQTDYGVNYDVAVLYNNRALDPVAPGQNGTNGISYIGQTCSSGKYFLVTAYSPNPIQTTAHEAGHNLSSPHDTGRINGIAYIMYFQSVSDRVSQFSPSSISTISSYVESSAGSCLAVSDGTGAIPAPTPEPTATPDPGSGGGSDEQFLSLSGKALGNNVFRLTATLFYEDGSPVSDTVVGLFLGNGTEITRSTTNSNGQVTFSVKVKKGKKVNVIAATEGGVSSRTIRLVASSKSKQTRRPGR